ncbi:MAG: TolC family protein [Bacteroidia bacterium]|nr:TolC family protein [Bacteroidia bacterium]
MKRILFLCYIFFCFPVPAQWTYEKLLAEAEARNLNFRISRNNLSISKSNLLQAKGNFLPTLNLGASHTYNFGKTIDRFTNTFANRNVLSQNFFIGSNWVLFNGMSRYHQLRAMHYSYLSEEAAYRNALLDLRMNVGTAYLNALLAKENLNIAQSQRNLTEFQLKRMKSMVEAGTLAKAALADLQAQMENENLNVLNAENNLRLQMLTLKQICGLDNEKEFEVAPPDLNTDLSKMEKWMEANPDEVFQKISARHPALQSAEYAEKASEMARKAAQGAKFPVISLNGAVGTGYSGLASEVTSISVAGFDTVGFTSGGQFVFVPKLDYQTRTKPFFDQYKENVNKSFGITLTVPLFNNFQTHTAAEQSKIRMENARLNKELAVQNLKRTVEQNVRQFQAAYLRYKGTIKNEEAAEISFKMNEERLNNGAANMQDYLQAKNRLSVAKFQKAQALYEALFRLTLLELMLQHP